MSEWIAGRNPVNEALKAGRQIDKLLIQDGVKHSTVAHVIRMAKEAGVVVQYVHRSKLDSITGGAVHQGIVAVVSSYTYTQLEDVLAHIQRKREPAFLLVLDQLEDPHNLGTILRTADATGVHAVIIPKRRAVGLTNTVAKTSAGAIEYVPVIRVTNLVRTIKQLKDEGIWVIGSDADAPLSYTDVDFTVPTALVIGSEGKGMSRLVRETCDQLVQLPMYGRINSLNAAVAAGLLMYEVVRKRRG